MYCFSIQYVNFTVRRQNGCNVLLDNYFSQYFCLIYTIYKKMRYLCARRLTTTVIDLMNLETITI